MNYDFAPALLSMKLDKKSIMFTLEMNSETLSEDWMHILKNPGYPIRISRISSGRNENDRGKIYTVGSVASSNKSCLEPHTDFYR